ncbi:MAG: hypothetical protein LHV69_09745 [Elusimicrobia bacterium]|nr:hypothetical protein [Candidatus Obscuribacterium magneticum]
MAESTRNHTNGVRPMEDVMKEISGAVGRERTDTKGQTLGIKDYRWQFDQISARMNQAIYNDQFDQIHDSCLETIAVLVEILARTKPTK